MTDQPPPQDTAESPAAPGSSPAARRKRARRRGWIIGTAIAAVAIVVATTAIIVVNNGNSADAAAKGGEGKKTIRVALTIEPDWDPLGTIGGGGVLPAQSLVYDALIRQDADEKLTPALATSWEYSEDGLTLTFHLREGLTFSDGAPFDAAAVKKHFDRQLANGNAYNYSGLPDVASVTAVDDATVAFNLSKVNYQLPALLSSSTKNALIESPNTTPESLVTTPVGNGPFIVTDIVVDDHYILEKNPDYWDADSIHVDRIEFYGTADPASVVSAVQTGVYDIAWVQPAQVKEAEKAGLGVTTSDAKITTTLQFNVNKAPFDNPKVVEALKYAIDRDKAVETLTFGLGDPAYQPFLKGTRGYVPDLDGEWAYDPEKAKKLLAEAGYDESHPLEFTYLVGENSTRTAEFYQQQLADIGVTATIETVPAATSFTRITQGKEAVLSTGFAPEKRTIQSLANVYGPTGTINLSTAPYVNEPIWDIVSTKLGSEPLDSDAYTGLLEDVAREAVASYPDVYVYSTSSYLIHNDRVSDLNIPVVASYAVTLRWEDVEVAPE
jgi:peptide/nickel transport system substrate-binding protein